MITAFSTLADIHLSPFLLALLLSGILPPIVGFFTKLTTHPAVKSMALLALNAIVALLTGAAMVGSDYVITKESITTAILAFVVSLGTYNVFWRKLGITSSLYTPPPTLVKAAAVLPGAEAVPLVVNAVPIPGKLAHVGPKAA